MIITATHSKSLQIITALIGSATLAFETATLLFLPCCLALIIDIITAHNLGRRVKRRYPGKADGKFKSKYIRPILQTLIVAFLCLVLAALVDELVLRDTGQDMAARFVLGLFLFYEAWSVLENISSENDAPIARALQRIMVNKAERHFNTPLADILLNNQIEQSNDKGTIQ